MTNITVLELAEMKYVKKRARELARIINSANMWDETEAELYELCDLAEIPAWENSFDSFERTIAKAADILGVIINDI